MKITTKRYEFSSSPNPISQFIRCRFASVIFELVSWWNRTLYSDDYTWSGAVIGSFRWTSTCPGAHRPRRPCCTACCSCRRRSNACRLCRCGTDTNDGSRRSSTWHHFDVPRWGTKITSHLISLIFRILNYSSREVGALVTWYMRYPSHFYVRRKSSFIRVTCPVNYRVHLRWKLNDS